MRAKTPSFIAEFPLVVTAASAAVIATRLEAARQIYNACLGEALRLLDLMRESKDWQQARAMPKGKARSNRFKAATRRFGFDRFTLQKFAEECRDSCWIGDHLGSHDTQMTSLRAFRAVPAICLRQAGQAALQGQASRRFDRGQG